MRRPALPVLAALVGAGFIVLFVDWLANARTEIPHPARYGNSFLYLGATLAGQGTGFAGELTQRLRIGIAVLGIASAGLGIYLLARLRASAAARQLAYLLVGYAAFTGTSIFLGIDRRYEVAPGWRPALRETLLPQFAFLALALARFFVLFPRPVDADSIHRTYWLRQRGKARGPRFPSLLSAWHASLLRGRILWIVPGVFYLVSRATEALDRAMPHASGAWGGVFGVIVTTALGFLLVAGYPFAFASTTHLYRNGSGDDRRRVRWLRAVVLAAAVALFLLFLGCLALLLGLREEVGLRVVGASMAGLALLPTAFIAALAIALLYGGALDPRVAVTRFTLWTFLGVAIAAIFLVVERYAAVKLVEWLGLPRETGLVAAGAVIAATFVPLRRAADRAVTRIADRVLPLEVVAEGTRLARVVAITDLSGYTALSATDETRALLLGALLKRQGERVVQRNGGRLVKSMGDAVMLTFDSAGSAVAAVAELHRDFAAAAATVGIEPLPLHSGLHAGEVVESHDGDIYGQTVNVTARLVDAAAAGQVVLSEAVRAALPRPPALADIGERRFKNVPDPVRCFRLETETPA